MAFVHPDDWNELGIAPTDEAAAIKRAYALRLRRTRPDDDPAAYQRLREAYDRVLAGIASVPRAPLPAAIPEEALAVAASPAAAEPVPPPPPDTPALLRELMADAGRKRGAAAMVEAWPGVRARLDALPMAERHGASACFADFVLADPSLPPALLAELQAYFGWLQDFRTERQLGLRRASELQRLYAERSPRPVTDPRLLWLYRHLLALHALLRQGQKWRAAWLAMLVGMPIERLIAGPGTAVIRRLGIGDEDLQQLRGTLKTGFALRAVVLVGAASALAWCFGVEPNRIAHGVYVGGLMALAAYRALPAAVLQIHRLLRLRVLPARWAMHPAVLRSRSYVPIAGLAIMVAGGVLAAAGGALHAVDAIPIGIMLSLAGALLAWPAEPLHGWLCAAMWIALPLLLDGDAALWGYFVGGLWFLLTALLIERQLTGGFLALIGRHGGRDGPERPGLLERILVLPLLLLALPLMALLAAHRFGPGIVLAALLAGVGLRFMDLPASHAWWPLIAVPAAMIVLLVLQTAVTMHVDTRSPARAHD